MAGIYFKVTSVEDKTVEVAHEYYIGDVVIPSMVDYNGTTYAVTSIGKGAFSGCCGLESIVIPNSVTEIGYYAFGGCTGLTSIVIPNSVTKIGRSAFSGCSGLNSINVVNGNSKYDSRENCNAIIETETNTLIAGCQNTKIPDSVTTIGEGAFDGCSGLKSIVIPNSVTKIGDYAFYGSRLKSIEIPNSVTEIGDYAFRGCSGLKSIEIPNSVTKIGDYAFYGSGLNSIEFPNSVTEIGKGAFYSCSGLKCIISNIPAEKLFPTKSVFEDTVISNCTLYVPKGAKEVYAKTEGWRIFKNVVELAE